MGEIFLCPRQGFDDEYSHPLRSGNIAFDEGIAYIAAGGVEAMPDWLLPKREWHTSQSLAVPQFVQVVVASNNLELRAIDEEGRLIDKLRFIKGEEGKKVII